jgi:intein-encoded DNA endonuclease-like protein
VFLRNVRRCMRLSLAINRSLENMNHKRPKPRGVPSKISTLATDQRAQMDGWLFDENLIYAEVSRRIRDEFGVVISPPTLCAYYVARKGKGKPNRAYEGKIRLLATDRRAQVDRWLFDENLIYAEVSRRIRDEFGVVISPSTLCAYYVARRCKGKPNRAYKGKIRTLSSDQRVQVDRWLFDENLIYTEISRRIQREFGVETCPSTLRQYYVARKGKGQTKPRGKIRTLAPSDRAQLHEWLRRNPDYSEIAKLAQQRFGLKISTGCLSNYYATGWTEIFGPVRAEAHA